MKGTKCCACCYRRLVGNTTLMKPETHSIARQSLLWDQMELIVCDNYPLAWSAEVSGCFFQIHSKKG